MNALELALDMKREDIVEILCAQRESLKSQPGADSSNPEKFSTNAGSEPVAERAEGGRISLRSRVVAALESEENATRVLKLLEDSKDTVVKKMIAFLRVSGLGETIYLKYLQDYDDDALRRLFVNVLEIPLD
ncbi:uncharacterized protein LOC119441610 [Dermacentor silvarum]|uniref:uncharacterized protein LOC119441610 n=1 Tax=Dermacentor silvarum TaxID=543639 RepID=UPI00189C24C1|nr:uncharacterized protein LOC119441610 [Dermacentor silvarum]